MKKSTVCVLFVVLALFVTYSFAALLPEKGVVVPLLFGEQVYEKDIEGVLGPGDPHELEIKRMEAYLLNLFLKQAGDNSYIQIGRNYRFYAGTLSMRRSGVDVCTVELLYYQPTDTSFMFELTSWGEGNLSIERDRKEYAWDQELYEEHLTKAYKEAVFQYPDVYEGHPMVHWYFREVAPYDDGKVCP